MGESTNQSKIIQNLNAYMDWHNIPSSLRLGGVCHGLSLLYIKYFFENKTQEFFDELAYLAGKNPSSSQESRVNQFVIEVLKAATPRLWNPAASQALSYKDVMIDGLHPLSPSFSLGLVTLKTVWSEIFENINLHTNEVMLLSSGNHTVVVTRQENGDFTVYDPNADVTSIYFHTADELMDALQKNIFWYANDNLGFEFTVFNHPCAIARTDFPDVHQLYDDCLVFQPEDVASYKNQNEWTTLDLAVAGSDLDVLKQIVNKGKYNEKDLLKAAFQAMRQNSLENFSFLFSKITEKANQNSLILHALDVGDLDAYDIIMKQHRLDYHLVYVAREDFMRAAAKGGNVKLLGIISDIIKDEENLMLEPDNRDYETSIFFHDAPSLLHNLHSDRDASTSHINSLNKLSEVEQIREVFPINQLDMNEALLFKENTGLLESILMKDETGKDAIMYAIDGILTNGLEFLLNLLEAEKRPLSPQERLYYLEYAIQRNHPQMVKVLIDKLKTLPHELAKINLSRAAMLKSDIEVLTILKDNGVQFNQLQWDYVMAQKTHQPRSILTVIGIKLLEFVYFLQHILFGAVKNSQQELQKDSHASVISKNSFFAHTKQASSQEKPENVATHLPLVGSGKNDE